MLHFNKLILHNFGPYKGQQIIDFTIESGVTIFWGNNGRGKTTLLNIIGGLDRYTSGDLIINREIN